MHHLLFTKTHSKAEGCRWFNLIWKTCISSPSHTGSVCSGRLYSKWHKPVLLTLVSCCSSPNEHRWTSTRFMSKGSAVTTSLRSRFSRSSPPPSCADPVLIFPDAAVWKGDNLSKRRSGTLWFIDQHRRHISDWSCFSWWRVPIPIPIPSLVLLSEDLLLRLLLFVHV